MPASPSPLRLSELGSRVQGRFRNRLERSGAGGRGILQQLLRPALGTSRVFSGGAQPSRAVRGHLALVVVQKDMAGAGWVTAKDTQPPRGADTVPVVLHPGSPNTLPTILRL